MSYDNFPPHLKFLSISGHSGKAHGTISQLTNLIYLEIQESYGVQDEVLKQLTNLTYLDAYQSRNVSDESISVLTNLTAIDIDSTSVLSECALNPDGKICYSCGSCFHFRDKCPVWTTKYRCSVCGGLGHLESMCRKNY